ncbi:TetR/AcrR family transcriptional regulator [Embleya scabrispora]|uniref:TetR/AcrR family transcriptional regulator n=1 Tax=Embleya scabrispora TaxID=159449 RepID=UPI00037B9B62|nr:TetR family transcriptional regulator [Embleya scabrispora]
MTTAKRTNPDRPDRLVLIGDTAIRLLVERGMRGLTHRAVDEGAGLPPGSTSYYARTRAALLEVALARMTVLEAGEFAPALADGESPAALPDDLMGIADLVAAIVDAAIRDGRDQKIARYELALEATRRPELRTVYDEAGAVFRGAAVGMLAVLGSRAPERHGRFLVAWCEGVMFDAIAGAGWATPPSRAEIRLGVIELLSGMLADATPRPPARPFGNASTSDMGDSPDRS